MKSLITNPFTLLVVGATLIGIGIDVHKGFVIAPGIAIAFSGLVLGIKWCAENS